MKLSAKKITTTAVMLALCIISQLFKNVSPFITGPIINLILIITTLYCGAISGTILAFITPLTSFLITGSPILSALPIIIPCIIIGNELLVLSISLSRKIVPQFISSKRIDTVTVISGSILGALLKYIFMTLSIVNYILPTMGIDKLKAPAITAASATFSTSQLITALVGGAIACVIWPILKKAFSGVEKE